MPRRGGECRSAETESPECAKGLGKQGKLSPCACPDRGRLGVPAQAAPQGGSRFSRARPAAFALAASTDVPPLPLRRAYRRVSRLAPAARPPVPPVSALPAAALLQMPISWSAPAGRRGEAPKYLLPSILRLSRCGTCKTGELAHTIYRWLDLLVTSVLVLSMKYFCWHPSHGERGKMCHGKIRNEVIPHVGTE